jgi:hypothetical protein
VGLVTYRGALPSIGYVFLPNFHVYAMTIAEKILNAQFKMLEKNMQYLSRCFWLWK